MTDPTTITLTRPGRTEITFAGEKPRVVTQGLLDRALDEEPLMIDCRGWWP